MAARAIKAGGAFVGIYSDDSQLVRGLKVAEARVKRFGGSVQAVGGRIATLGAGVTSLAGVGAAAIAWPLQLAANMETAEASFTTLLKDQEKAKTLLGELQKFAASTPFQFDELADASKKLLAFGSEAGNVQAELRRIGDISSAIGAPIGEVAEIYGKARVQGRLFAEDINQLTGRGIPVIQELAKQFGVSDQEVRKLVSDGKVGFANLERAFVSLTSGAGQFAGGMERQSRTLSGAFSTLKDNVVAAFRPFGESLLPAAKAALQVGTQLVQKFGEFAERNKEIAIPLAVAVAGVGALGVAATAAGVAIIGVGAAISAVGTIIGTVGTIVSAVGAPAVLIAAGIALQVTAIGGAFAYVASQAGLIAPAFDFLKNAFGRVFATFQQTFGGIVAALQGGRFRMAAGIAWAGVKVATLQGTQEVLRGIEALWDNAGSITAKFFNGLLITVGRVFKSIPRLMFAALRGGRAIQDVLRGALVGALDSKLDLAAALDPAIARAQQQLQQRTGLARRLGANRQAPGGPPPRVNQIPALRPQGAPVPAFQVPQGPSVAAAVNGAARPPVQRTAAGPGLAELVGLSRQQLMALRQLVAEGLG